MPTPILRLTGLSKSFAGVAALKTLTLAIDSGQVVGLIGENGAGKSTLIKLISGVHRPTTGYVQFQGDRVDFRSPRDALDAGIATIHQELEYCGHLRVAENMLLGDRWPRRFWGGVHWQALRDEARRQLAEFGIDLDPRRRFEDLTPAEKQEVAIASALSRDARLLILDEPTASLTEPEVKRLFAHIGRLKTRGVTVVYVSHRMDEITRLTDRVIVLRDGGLAADRKTAEVAAGQLVQDMVGRSLDQVNPRTRGRAPGEPLLELQNVSRAGMFRDVSLTVRAGEIVGLGGLVGAGRSELARAVYGLYPIDSGGMKLCGRAWQPRGASRSLRSGLVYIPEERKRQGFVLDHPLGESISIGFSDLLSRMGLIGRKRESSRLAEILKTYDIRAEGPQQPVGTLSGGNQQKALLARMLERSPRVIVLDEPTRGVDVGAKTQIHAIIDQLAASGKAVLLISSDLPELVGMSDRILVMNRGALSAELTGNDMTEHNVLLAASGLYDAGGDS